MKVSLNNLIKNNSQCIIEGLYTYNIDAQKLRYKIPNISVKGGILFLLPKDYSGKYYLSVAKETFYFQDGIIYEEVEEGYKVNGNGWIYILSNPSMPQNLIKIGMTARNPEVRVKELSAKTAVPQSFQIIFQKEVAECDRVEKLIHSKLDKYRYQPNKEFFKIPPEKLLPILEEFCSKFPPKDIPSALEIQKRKELKK
jgi:hypothetical protein